MFYILFLIIILYCLAIIALIYGFTKVNTTDTIDLSPKTQFSILVPFRNEAENLPKLLESFTQLNYPSDLFEVILVDDASDGRFKMADCRFKISIIDNLRVSNSPKKDAITTAIPLAKNDWIITTDADCLVNKNWLLALDNYIQTHSVLMIAGAVTYNYNNSFLHHFQQLDLASLQGASIGSFGLGKGFMCNGANFAYTKSFFRELNGFEGNNQIASGDDVFLLQKAIARYPEKVHYLKSINNIVHTKPLNDWKSLFHQRLRWASKTSSYQSRFGIGLGLVVFLGNLGLLFVVYCLLLEKGDLYGMLFLLLAKIVVDFLLIHKTNSFLKSKTNYYLLGSLVYPFFSVSVALYSMFGKYEWKGRTF
jgi:cellulose synthase/poly-beta-1,6-N-acetylglucosamine synthase-like glycosyltransferase